MEFPTDVLSFPEFELTPGELPGAEDADPGTGYVPLGTMVISLERVKAQARIQPRQPPELAYLAVHSVLHLLATTWTIHEGRCAKKEKRPSCPYGLNENNAVPKIAQTKVEDHYEHHKNRNDHRVRIYLMWASPA